MAFGIAWLMLKLTGEIKVHCAIANRGKLSA
jgi:hypothetical protein